MALPPHSFAEKFVRTNILGRWWSWIGIAIEAATSYFVLNGLSIYEYGLYQLVLAAVALGGMIAVGSFDVIVSNELSRHLADGKRGEAKRLFLEFVVFKVGAGTLVALILMAAAGFIAAFYGRDIASYVRLASILFVLRAGRSVMDIFLGAVISLRAMGAGAVEGLVRLGLISAFFFFWTLGIRQLLLTALVASAAAIIYVAIPFAVSIREHLIAPQAGDRRLLWQLIRRYGFWVFFRTAVAHATDPLRPFLIRIFLNTEAVAVYKVAENLITLIKKNAYPQLSSSLFAWEVGNVRRLAYIFSRSMKYSFWYGCLLTFFSAAAVPLAVAVLFPKYLLAMPLFWLFALSLPFHGMYKAEYHLLTALGEQKTLAMRLLTEIGVNTAANVILLPFIGLYAIGITITSAVAWRALYYYRKLVLRHPDLSLKPRAFFKFDAEDRIILRRGLAEARAFLRRS